MTKAELIEAMKGFPDDMKVKTIDDYGCWDVEEVYEDTFYSLHEKFILIR